MDEIVVDVVSDVVCPWCYLGKARLEQAMDLCAGSELMVIGGGEIYALAMPHAQQMHLTHVATALPQADAWFPEIDDNDWLETASEDHDADERHAHAFRFADYFRLNLP
ncbi:MAG: hypothetical protein RIR97_1648 [Pseudomonadota bacterium]